MLFVLIQNLIEWDQSLFQFLNGRWTNNFFDYLLPVYRNKYFWIPIYTFIISFMVMNFRRKSYMFILCLIACVGTTDYVSSQLIKKTVKRVRPCNDAQVVQVRSLVRCGSGYSFTSNHAANHFALSFFMIFTIGRFLKKARWPLFLWAISVAYAQVYVGVHYPIDVFSGALLGIVIASLFRWLYAMTGKAISRADLAT